jgi:hypothetical protein
MIQQLHLITLFANVKTTWWQLRENNPNCGRA